MPVKNKKSARPVKLPREAYERELYRLQGELVKMQGWMRETGARMVVIFEGRDAAGKGGTIKRVAEYLNPRSAPVVALPAPGERERGQWYFQRYVDHLPTAGELVLFDRSWYNRAGVEHVMGFCTRQEYMRFLHQCPIFERLLVEDGILLRKYWFSVSDEEQQRRFRERLDDPMRRWKLSPMDLESITHWEDYSRAKDEMFVHTDIPEAPWHVLESDDKRRAQAPATAAIQGVRPPAAGHAGLRPRLRREGDGHERALAGAPASSAAVIDGPEAGRRPGMKLCRGESCDIGGSTWR
jgi:polyphosphate kinase 2